MFNYMLCHLFTLLGLSWCDFFVCSSELGRYIQWESSQNSDNRFLNEENGRELSTFYIYIVLLVLRWRQDPHVTITEMAGLGVQSSSYVKSVQLRSSKFGIDFWHIYIACVLGMVRYINGVWCYWWKKYEFIEKKSVHCFQHLTLTYTLPVTQLYSAITEYKATTQVIS